MAVFGSFVKLWPYNLSLTLAHYTYGFEEANVEHAYRNSLVMAGWCAAFGAAITFAGAYWVEKTRGAEILRPLIRLQAMLPMAVPGMVLGIGYILFFNAPANPLDFLYGTMAILVVCTVVHFYSSSHLTAVTALKQLDAEFESVSASLKVPFYKTFWRVTVPVCLPTILDISRYYFVNAMTTISAVVFLYSPKTMLAAISILQLDEAGRDRFRRRDGDADRRHVGRRDGRHARGGGAAARAHAEVARAGEDVNDSRRAGTGNPMTRRTRRTRRTRGTSSTRSRPARPMRSSSS